MLKNYSFFTTDELKPKGWMLDQLILQKNGLNGNLDKVWPDVRDSQWIGGDREGWERVPYWLDGFIPLAYLLDDDDMKMRAKKYIDKILEGQQEDGWICPNGDTPREKYDTWAVLLISKVLVVYYECSKDKRIPAAVYKTLKNYFELLNDGTIKLFSWARYRWFEGFIALKWVKEQFGEEQWMRELARILVEQGTDYDKISYLWEVPMNRWRQDTHVVNIVMMLKSEAVSCEFLGEEYTDLGDKLYTKLKKYNGTAVETLTGDECLSGVSPIQGTELCSVVELMYSFERLYAATGDIKWAERLERVAYNALPATVSDDMWTHQYDQLVNQISCVKFDGNPIFRTNGKDAHVFGLEPFFGCCTANFGQGWPKLALSAFARNEEELVGCMFIPSELNFEWKGTPITVALETKYPFENRLVYKINTPCRTDLKFKLRIPSFAKELKINGKNRMKKDYIEFKGFKQGETVIEVEFKTTPELVRSPSGMYNAHCGSLVFAANINASYETVEYTKDGVERKFPYCDYKIAPVGDWSFAFASNEIKIKSRELSNVPFSSKAPALLAEAELCCIDWGYEAGYDNICAKKPKSKKPLGEAFKVDLYPYGCAKLRMTEMPLIKNK